MTRLKTSFHLLTSVEIELFSLKKKLHSWVIRSGLASDVCVGYSLVDLYEKYGAVENSWKLFNRMSRHNVMSWTTLISRYMKGRQELKAMKLFCSMLHGHVAPNYFTFSNVIKVCASVVDFGSGKQLHDHTIKLGFSMINCVGNSLVDMYASNTVIHANAIAKQLDSEESFNHEIEQTGIGASSFTYVCLVSGTACLGTIGKGEQIHALIVKSGFGTNLCINNALICMYSKYGNKEAALQAWKHFNSKHYNYRIVQRMEYYACMVDLLRRSGMLLEAIEFINSMPFDAKALVWHTFLSSCWIHRNTKLWEHVAKLISENLVIQLPIYYCQTCMHQKGGRMMWQP
ncbi:hypothetical protein VNO78_09891 [Psophocarpus tetragonolobus]|uniref:Pentatricopeptide repeat-containing protein n=1 Tax=Psophocarpus tetragonolobus TaxID=3891 RepID=A0AAN9XTT6_PSOTE